MEPEVNSMSAILALVTDFLTVMLTWLTTVITYIVGQPLLLLPFIMGLGFGMFKIVKKMITKG